jgi:SDR family mycofactocin-dependent oxidoreductase
MSDLTGRVALITGAARGQGRSHALRLASDGADLVLCDVCSDFGSTDYPGATFEDLQETVQMVEKATGRRVLARQADVRDLDAMQSLADEALSEFGRLDVVVANAGVMSAGRAWELTPEQWKDVIDVNLTGTFYTLKAAVPAMISAGNGGSIIVISSAAGRKGTPFAAHYSASKHGLVGLARTFALELGEHDIRVNTVHPVGVATLMVSGPTFPKLLAEVTLTIGPTYMNTLPYEFLQPEAVTNMVAWLAGDESRYCTGSEFVIDLGNTSR